MNTTPVSLLERLRRPAEEEAWARFVKLYTPLLFYWAGRVGAQGQDAADLVQDVFLSLVRKLPEFQYDRDKSFRGWLWTILLNKWREKQRRACLPAVERGPEFLAGLADPNSTGPISEAEYRQYVVKRALELMQADFQPATWQAFWACAIDDRPAAEVAAELGLSLDAVYAAKSRVLRRLRRELDGLMGTFSKGVGGGGQSRRFGAGTFSKGVGGGGQSRRFGAESSALLSRGGARRYANRTSGLGTDQLSASVHYSVQRL
jgi:RNA polymerase sigma-70 factor (ECF subfamily)